MRESLGNLEQLVLLIVLYQEKTYAVDLAKEFDSRFSQPITLPAIHVVLKRLEQKGFVKSAFGEPTAQRGGRRKRYYEATREGYQISHDLQQSRNEIWKLIPKIG